MAKTLNEYLDEWRQRQRVKRNLIIGLSATLLISGATVCLAERNNSDSGRDNGESSGGYGHTFDGCGTACGTSAVFIGDGRNGPAYSGNTWHGPIGQAERNGY